MTKCWEFKLKLEKKTIKTFVYSDDGKDIISRFPNNKVTNIKEITNPLKDVVWTDSKPKGKKERYIELPKNIKDRSKADVFHKKIQKTMGESVNEGALNEAASWGQVKTFLLGILRKKQATKMDGFRVDLQTANAILQVGNALNQPNQKKYGKLPIRKMARVAWKLIK